VNISRELGRWLAAAVSLGAIFGALWRVYAMEYRHFLLGFAKNHVVICGVGWRGLPLARDFCCSGNPGGGRSRENRKVIVIEKDPECDGLRECEKLGIAYLVDDASNPKALKAARVHHARTLIAACSEDGTNLEI